MEHAQEPLVVPTPETLDANHINKRKESPHPLNFDARSGSSNYRWALDHEPGLIIPFTSSGAQFRHLRGLTEQTACNYTIKIFGALIGTPT